MLNLRKFRLLISIISLLLSALVLCDELFAYNMQDAVYQTLRNHPKVLASKADVAAAEQGIRIAQGGLYPSLDVSAGIGRENSNNPATRSTGSGSRTFTRRETEIFLQQLVFDGGNVLGNVKQRRFDYDQSTHQVTETQIRITFDAVSAYLNVIRYREIVAVRELDVKAHRELVQKVKRRLAAGAGRKSEISLAKARLALSLARLEATQGLLENALDTFNKVIGQPAPRSLLQPGIAKGLPGSEEEARRIAIQMNPSIKVNESQVLSVGAGIGIAQSAFYPRFTLDLSSSYNNNLDGVPGRNEDAQAMLRMTYNLLNGGSDLAAVRAAKNREREAVEQLANTRRDVIEEVSLSWNDFQASKARLPNLRAHRDDSLEVFNAYVKQFQLGQRTLFDLLNSQAEYYDASINYIDGRFDLHTQSYRILASMGTILHYLAQSNFAIDKAVEQPFNYQSEAAQPARYASHARATTEHPAVAAKVTEKISAQNKTATPSTVAQTSDEISAIMNKPTNSQSQPSTAAKQAVAKANRQYTLQLYAANTEQAADRFIKKNHLEGNAKVVSAEVAGRTIYRVLNGQYQSRSLAMQAIDGLPASVQSLQPLVRVTAPRELA